MNEARFQAHPVSIHLIGDTGGRPAAAVCAAVIHLNRFSGL